MKALILVGFLLAGCKTDKPAPSARSGSGSAAGSAATRADATTPSAGMTSAGSGSAQVPIKLPTSTGTPPNKTTAELTQEQADRMAAIDVQGFKKEVRSPGFKGLDIRFRTESRPILSVSVKASRCLDCKPMQVAKWDKDALLKELMPIEMLRAAHTTFDLGVTEINGAPAIYVYQLGSLFAKDDSDNPGSAYTNAYSLFYNDGVNMIRVIASYKDEALDVEDLQKIAPKEDLERIAKSFADAYTHAW